MKILNKMKNTMQRSEHKNCFISTVFERYASKQSILRISRACILTVKSFETDYTKWKLFCKNILPKLWFLHSSMKSWKIGFLFENFSSGKDFYFTFFTFLKVDRWRTEGGCFWGNYIFSWKSKKVFASSAQKCKQMQ